MTSEHIQATASSEGEGVWKRYDIHITSWTMTMSLYDLRRKDMVYLKDLIDGILEETKE